jgi:hypothetical protein
MEKASVMPAAVVIPKNSHLEFRVVTFLVFIWKSGEAVCRTIGCLGQNLSFLLLSARDMEVSLL